MGQQKEAILKSCVISIEGNHTDNTGKIKNMMIIKNVAVQKKITMHLPYTIRLIYQGTVNNNLGTDHLEGPKALDPYYCRQPTL